MPVDSSIYNNYQGLNLLGSVQQGMSMRDQMDQRNQRQELMAREKATREAYSAGVVKNPDGTITYDQGKTLSALAGVGGKEYLDEKQKLEAQTAATQKANLEKQMQQMDVMGRLAGTAVDQGTYSQSLAQAKAMGIDTTQMPANYDPNVVRSIQNRALSAKEQLANQYQQQHGDRDFQLREKELESRALDRKDARDERRFQAGLVRSDKMQSLQTPFGQANTVDDAKQLKESYESKRNFDNKLQQMIDLREKHGGGATMNREDVARGKQLSKDLLLEYKNLAKLGVLSQSDENIINAIIPEDPLQYNSPLASIQGQDPTLARLKSFQADSDKDFRTKIGTRTQAGLQQTQANERTGAFSLKGKPTDRIPPSSGKVVDGYKFKGGDPSKQENWEKI